MRRAPCLTLGLSTLALAATGLADAAQAQSAPQYLRWAGRPEVASAPTTAVDTSAPSAQRRPNRVIPHGGAIAAPAVEAAPPPPARRTLTPATAWLRPPAAAPSPAPAVRAPAPASTPARSTPEYLPEQGGRGQPVPAEVALPAAQPAPMDAPAPVDPYAPRRDAPIFRMQQSQTPPPAAPASAAAQPPAEAEAPPPRRVAMVAANPEDRPIEQGARYYSVHRQSGREPDAVALPAPTYVDALTISTPVSIASPDLAQPDPGPTLIRDAQGRTRVQPAAPEGDYQ